MARNQKFKHNKDEGDDFSIRNNDLTFEMQKVKMSVINYQC